MALAGLLRKDGVSRKHVHHTKVRCAKQHLLCWGFAQHNISSTPGLCAQVFRTPGPRPQASHTSCVGSER